MKKLVRGDGPVCLTQFKYGRDNWSVIYEHGLTNDIWAKINDMQHGFCAYCECKLVENNSKRHIEHFIQRNINPKLTFSWDNIFGSCCNPNRCGKHKDESLVARRIDLANVCKPDMQDSGNLLLFLNSGKVRAKSGLTVQDNELAINTIAVFNLDGDSTLDNSRRTAIAAEKALATSYWEMLASNNLELADLLEDELSEALIRIESFEHSTALKHLWLYSEVY